MEALFFKSSLTLEEIKTKFYSALGIDYIEEGESSHYPEGIYFLHSVFGVRIELSNNNYGYDDVYNFYVSVKKDVLSNVQKNDQVVKLVKDILLLLLPNSLHTEIAYEKSENDLALFKPM